MSSIGVVDKASESNAVPIYLSRTFRSIYEDERAYNIQGVVPVNVVSPKRKLCTVDFGASDTVAAAATPDAGGVNLVVEDGVTKLVFAPFIAADETVFPDTLTIALFDVDTGQVNAGTQFLGAQETAKQIHESGSVCYYNPVVFDNIFMTNKVALKVKLDSAPGAVLSVSIGAFVGGDAVLPLPSDEYWANVSLLVQPDEAAEDGDTDIVDYAGSTVSVVGTTNIDIIGGIPAINFPADGDRVVVPHRDDFNFPLEEDFTIESFFYGRSTTALEALFGHRETNANNSGWYVCTESSRVWMYMRDSDDNTNITVSTPASVVSDQLHYIRITRASGVVTASLDGVDGTPVSMVGVNIYPHTKDLAIGVRSASEIVYNTWSPGSIVSVRITNGVARTGDVPSSPFFPPRGA